MANHASPNVGEVIKYDNLLQETVSETFVNKDSGGGGVSKRILVRACCFQVHMRLVKNWGSWGRENTVDIYAFDGYRYQLVWSMGASLGQFDSGTYDFYFNHNWNGNNSSTMYKTAAWWLVDVSFSELYHRYLWIDHAGIGSLPEAEYDTYHKGKPIHRIWISGRAVMEDSRSLSTILSEDVGIQSVSKSRGTMIGKYSSTTMMHTDYYS